MKKIALILISFLISVGSMAQDNALHELGEKFCCDYIDGLRPGSYHRLDCLDYVDTIDFNIINNSQSLIESICNKAPDFYGLNGYISSAECIDAARELGFFESN